MAAYKVFFNSATKPLGTRVNAVAPSVVDTWMSNFAGSDAGHDFTLGIQALKRIAQPDDIAAAVVFLASEEARWITADNAARRRRLEAVSRCLDPYQQPTLFATGPD
jgi:NAD(P)-dependent dehydrogenase (short-subunit alcohol dehydrogenase family)